MIVCISKVVFICTRFTRYRSEMQCALNRVVVAISIFMEWVELNRRTQYIHVSPPSVGFYEICTVSFSLHIGPRIYSPSFFPLSLTHTISWKQVLRMGHVGRLFEAIFSRWLTFAQYQFLPFLTSIFLWFLRAWYRYIFWKSS